MNNIKTYILATTTLFIGFGIAWFVKPASHHHEAEASAGMTLSPEEIWTCSMHPQIRNTEAGICPICEMDLIPLDNTMGSDDPSVLKMSPASVKLAQVETFIVGGDGTPINSESLINVDGTIEMDERSINAQSTHLSGRIESIYVNFEGEYVRKGQKIATLFSTELLSASQELITASAYDDKIEGLKAASIQKLKNWKLSDSQIETILTTNQPIETIDIYADHSGYVLSKKVSLGDYVKQGQALYTVGKTNNLWLIFNVYESDLGAIRTGQKVSFTTPSKGSQEFSATISYIEPLLNNSSRTAVVRAEYGNAQNQLKPGMLLKGKIKSTPQKASDDRRLTIPRTALLWTGDRSVVYVQLPDTEVPSYQYREVIIQSQSGANAIISEGLSLGDAVVTNGAFAIDAAAQLNNNRSMMNRDVSIKKDSRPNDIPDYKESTPEAFKSQLNNIANAYILLKDALVETNPSEASVNASALLQIIDQSDMPILTDDAQMYWMENLKGLQSHTQQIIDLDQIEKQRDQFEFLSEAMIKTITAFGTTGEALYIQHCPMASDNEGADWISNETQIRNPYFGDKMMKCGIVKKEL